MELTEDWADPAETEHVVHWIKPYWCHRFHLCLWGCMWWCVPSEVGRRSPRACRSTVWHTCVKQSLDLDLCLGWTVVGFRPCRKGTKLVTMVEEKGVARARPGLEPFWQKRSQNAFCLAKHQILFHVEYVYPFANKIFLHWSSWALFWVSIGILDAVFHAVAKCQSCIDISPHRHSDWWYFGRKRASTGESLPGEITPVEVNKFELHSINFHADKSTCLHIRVPPWFAQIQLGNISSSPSYVGAIDVVCLRHRDISGTCWKVKVDAELDRQGVAQKSSITEQAGWWWQQRFPYASILCQNQRKIWKPFPVWCCGSDLWNGTNHFEVFLQKACKCTHTHTQTCLDCLVVLVLMCLC